MTFLSRLCSYHALEEMMSFILILGVVGDYNILFALTRTSGIGWALTGLLSLAGMVGLIWLSARPCPPEESGLYPDGTPRCAASGPYLPEIRRAHVYTTVTIEP